MNAGDVGHDSAGPSALGAARPVGGGPGTAEGDARAAARRLIEHLRSGVPLPPGDPPLTAGRDRLLARSLEMLDAVAASGSRAFAVQANYGDGKTHALRAIWHVAAQRGFVVSNVALTRETPLDRLDHVFPKVVAETYLPGARQPGLERLLQGLTADGQRVRNVLRFAAENLHPKIHAVLRNLLEGSSTEAAESLLQDLATMGLGVADLKRIHRRNFNQPLKLERFSAQRHAPDYFRLLDHLITEAGHAGWVILFDEAELLSRLGRGARARAYAHIGRLARSGMGCAHLLSVFAVASNFYDSVLERRHDGEQAGAWLEARGDAEGAAACGVGIATLREAVLLEPLTPSHWSEVMRAVLDAHELAYAWSAGLSAEDLRDEVRRMAPETDTKIRTRLRLAIQWLDLVYQHGAPPRVRLSSLGEIPLEWPLEPDSAEGEAAAGREPER